MTVPSWQCDVVADWRDPPENYGTLADHITDETDIFARAPSSIQYRVLSTDSEHAGGGSGYRSENRKNEFANEFSTANNEEMYLGWSTWFEEGWPAANGFVIITQLHPTGSDQPPVYIDARGSVLSVQIQGTGHAQIFETALDPIPIGRWLHFVLRIHWRWDDPSGEVELFLDGNSIYTKTGVTVGFEANFADATKPGLYTKQGVYRSSGYAGNATHVLHHSRAKAGATYDSVDPQKGVKVVTVVEVN